MNKKTKLLSILRLVTAILFLFSSEVLAQSLSISGKVIDKNSQEPVIGASVLIEGTSNGTITDLDGNFMLSNVPSKGSLVVSYIGYATQTLPINGRTSFSVVLAEDTETLEPGRSAPLREPSPLRTVHESFPSYGSSNSKFLL